MAASIGGAKVSNQEHPQSPKLAIEVAAAILVPAALFGLIRVFADFADVFQIMIFAFLSSATMIIGRRLKLPLLGVIALNLFLAYLAITWTYFRDVATGSIIPNGAYITAFGDSFGALRSEFSSQVSPVEGAMSFLLVGSMAAWLLAFLTDWGATRLKLAFEPVLPAVMIFILASIPPISSGENIVPSSLVFALGVCAWAITQRSVRISQGSVLVNSGPRAALGLVPLLIGGTVMAVLSVGVGVAYGDRLPFAQSEPVVEFSNNNAQGREVSNPFIDLEQRLVEQSETPLFQVTAQERTYWRIVGLDTYRNTTATGGKTAVWEVRIGGDNDKDTIYNQPDEIPGRNLTQRIEIGSLDVRTAGGTQSENVWIPAALSPTAVLDDGGAELNTDPLTQTITIGSDFSSAGLTYEVESAVPTFTREQLNAAAEQLEPAPLNSDIYLQVPDNVPDAILDTALEVTRGSTNRFEQAIALQNFFQGFEYNLDLEEPPSGLTAEEHFLETRTGFCQQFSGTFALMARLLGIPTRVAVGFTWGDVLEETPEGTRYGVKGRHAHAWPEVWFGDELGWVPFEPTPNRGLPGATQYTDIEPAQDATPGFEDPNPLEFEDTEPAEPNPAEPTEPDNPEPTPEDQNDNNDGAEEETPAASKPIDFSQYSPRRGFVDSFAPVLGVISFSFRTFAIIVLLLAYPLGLPAFVALRRRFRMKAIESTTSNPAQQIQQSWSFVNNEIRLRTGMTQFRPETATEFARRFGSQYPSSSEAAQHLAHQFTSCRYSPQVRTPDQGSSALAAAQAISHELDEQTPWHQRWRQSLSPNRVFGGNPLRLEAKSKSQPSSVSPAGSTS